MTMRSAQDASIPVLTEILDLTEEAARKLAGPLGQISTRVPDQSDATPQPLPAPPPRPLSASPPSEPAQRNTPAPPAEPPITVYSEEQMEALEHKVRDEVLRSLVPRVEELLETRLRNKLTDMLERVLAGMTAELKVSMKNTLRDAVSRAVAEELAKTLNKAQLERLRDGGS
jgi:hypothetical protein